MSSLPFPRVIALLAASSVDRIAGAVAEGDFAADGLATVGVAGHEHRVTSAVAEGDCVAS